MKRLLLCLILVCSLVCGCSSQTETEETAETVMDTDLQVTAAKSLLHLLTGAYWRYTKESLTYTPTNYKEEEVPLSLREAFARGGYEAPAEGTDCLLVTAELLHNNETAAGTAMAYLTADGTRVLAACYTPVQGALAACTLAERNLYLDESFPLAKETTAEGSFRALKADLHGRSAAAVQENRLCLLEDSRIALYALEEETFVLLAEREREEDRVPMSAAFLADGTLAVLFGHAMATDGEGSRTVSEEVCFFDDDLDESLPPFALEGVDCSLVAAHGEELILYGGTTLRSFVPEGEGFTQKLRRSLGHTAKALCICDMDGNGEDEYFMTDGSDCFLYRRDGSTFTLLWRTNLGTDWYNGPLSFGDTNGDGAAEIYLCDDNAAAIRYILGPRGLVSRNEDIGFGDARFAADFNGDGRCDYLQMDSDDNTTLYLAE